MLGYSSTQSSHKSAPKAYLIKMCGHLGLNWLVCRFELELGPSTRIQVKTRTQTQKSLVAGYIDLVWIILPDFPGLNTFTTVVLQVHIADLPYTPRLCYPHILSTVAEARHHLIHLTNRKTTVTCLISQVKCVETCEQNFECILQLWNLKID